MAKQGEARPTSKHQAYRKY